MNAGRNRIPRIIALVVCALVFIGLVAYSGLRVRYPVSGKPLSEAVITKMSLSHDVKRADDGMLALRPGSTDNKGAKRPCPT